MQAREKFNDEIEALQKELDAEGTVSELSEPGMKKKERASVKMEIKYGGDVSRLTDIFRATWIFETLEDMYKAVRLISTHESLKGPGGAVVTCL